MNDGRAEREDAKAERSRAEQQRETLLRCSEKRDMADWNRWRRDNRDEQVLLEGADLTGRYLKRVDLREANL